jgi:organic hydroperoxide reductase OsmC/OhrA
MSEFTAVVLWERGEATYTDNKYSRAHRWQFDGGVEVPASSSPQSVPLPLSAAAAVDPEEAFVAAISSCHMLWFLFIAAKRGFVVDRYRDAAAGVMGRNAAGKKAMTRVTLHPQVAFMGNQPTPAAFEAMHHEAHEECYIANSVNTEVRCEPVLLETS